jgi:hypothetical protein
VEIISSAQTVFVKKVFPVVWFGVVGFGFVAGLVSGEWRAQPIVWIQPLLMMAVGYVVMRVFVWDLADKVLDGGDFLLVTKSGIEERVYLRNVINVSVTRASNPARITLRLCSPGKLGDEVAFVPKGTVWIPFARHPLAEQLITRVDRLRTGN